MQNNAHVRKDLGELFTATGRTKESRNQFNEMLRLTSALVAQQPENHHSRGLTAIANQSLSDIERSTGDRDASRKYAIEALRIREELARDFPHIADYQSAIANGYGSVAISYAEAGDYKDAETFFVRGADAARKLAISFPSIPNYRYQAEISSRILGVFYLNTQRLEEAKVNLANTAELHLRAGDHDAALTSLKESMALPSDKTWETFLQTAQLLTQCSQRPDEFDSTIGDLAVAQLQQSIEAGLPNLEELKSERFAVLKELNSWKAIEQLLLEKK